MSQVITETSFDFPGQEGYYKGKVREVYFLGRNKLAAIASDRISAFDCILPKAIPFKGQVLNLTAAHFLRATADVVPNWLESTPHPNVSIGKRCAPIALEIVVRKYCTGHAWRTYKSGERLLCGVTMPEGMRENDPFPSPIITPATKAVEGHDEDISVEDILSRGIVTQNEWATLEKYALALFAKGTQMAKERGLILVDTKYEFGKDENGDIILIDEVHTPDSSRYFILEGYEQRQSEGLPQKQLSKEFVREWLIENGFQGKEGQTMPEMSDEFVKMVSERYIELYETVTGQTFDRGNAGDNIMDEIEKSITDICK